MISVYLSPTEVISVDASHEIDALEMLNNSKAVCVGSFLYRPKGTRVMRRWADNGVMAEYAANSLEEALQLAFEHYARVEAAFAGRALETSQREEEA